MCTALDRWPSNTKATALMMQNASENLKALIMCLHLNLGFVKALMAKQNRQTQNDCSPSQVFIFQPLSPESTPRMPCPKDFQIPLSRSFDLGGLLTL